MRILFLTSQLPEPAHAGGTLRTNGLMRGVHKAGHEVHLLSFATEEELTANRDALDEFCTSVDVVPPPFRKLSRRLRDLLLTNLADMQRRADSPLYTARLEQLLSQQKFDLIQIESLEMAAYLNTIQRLQPKTPVIYDSFNAEFALQRTIYEAERGDLRHLPGAIYSLMQWRRLTRFEGQICRLVNHVIAVSDMDAKAFHDLIPDVPVSVVPNGIDANAYMQNDSSLDLGPYALVFTGSMNYRPNIDAALWFTDHVLDNVRTHVPEAKFFIVGSNPHPRLELLRERSDVEITGWVPNVNPFLHAAAVYVVPLRMGSGTRLKLLQAMAAGRAVVSTTIGALGLDVRDGVELRLADTSDKFAQAIIELLKEPTLGDKLGSTGAGYVKTNYDWSVIVPRLLAIYDQLTLEARRKENEPAAAS